MQPTEALQRVNAFSDHQAYVLRSLSVTASCLSIGAGILAFYLYICMRTKVFRHHLILLLLMFDFGKAVVLLWYPARVLLVASAYNNSNFCDVVGFFTSAFIEGADLAVLALAIHTAMLIFLKFSGPEGGLYKYRFWVYGVNILLPLVMASLAFVNNGRYSYSPLITWCYLPVRPVWYRLVLSWVPRYIIFISIITIYISIYIYVKVQYSRVMKEFKQSQTYLQKDYNGSIGDEKKTSKTFFTWLANPFSSSSSETRQKMSFKKVATTVRNSILYSLSYLPGFGFLEPAHTTPSTPVNEMLDAHAQAMISIQRDTMSRFQNRRSMIERQIRSIFVYPLAYVFLWLAPFAVHCLQFNYEIKRGPVFWIGAIAAFMQPFNCVVDTVAFMVREKPWTDREERIFTFRNKARIRVWLWSCVPFAGSRRREWRDRRDTAIRERKDALSEGRPVGESSRNNSKGPDYNDSSFSGLDADLERFAGSSTFQSQTTDLNNSNPGGPTNPCKRAASVQTIAVNNDKPNRLNSQASTKTQDKNYTRNNSNRAEPEDLILATTARRPQFESSTDADDDSDGSMDLMEFLR